MNDYTPTTDEIRRAWWMDTDNPFDNESASDVSFDRWLAAHDAALLAAHPADKQAAERAAEKRYPLTHRPHEEAEAFVAGAEWSAALLAAHPATAIDRDTLIEFFTRCTIHAKAIDGVVSISAESMADALLASGVLGGQSS